MNTSDTTQETERQAMIDGLGITFEAMPADSNPSMDDSVKMDHWSVKLTRPDCPSMTLMYSMGIGHRRNPHKPNACYPGRIRTIHDQEQAAKFKPVKPKLIDILYCLVVGGDCLENTFEEWCDNWGYDVDSRKAERTFKLCYLQTIQVRRLLGDDLEAVQLALQDY